MSYSIVKLITLIITLKSSYSFLSKFSQLNNCKYSIQHLYAKKPFFSRGKKVNPQISNEEEVMNIEEDQLKNMWMKSGRPPASFNLQQAMMIFDTDDINDDGDGKDDEYGFVDISNFSKLSSQSNTYNKYGSKVGTREMMAKVNQMFQKQNIYESSSSNNNMNEENLSMEASSESKSKVKNEVKSRNKSIQLSNSMNGPNTMTMDSKSLEALKNYLSSTTTAITTTTTTSSSSSSSNDNNIMDNNKISSSSSSNRISSVSNSKSSPTIVNKTEDTIKGRSVGIDLGTTFSAVSVMDCGRPRIISVNGHRITPSIVGYLKNNDIIVGELARRQLVLNPKNTYASVKRVIGRSINEVISAGDKLSALKVDKLAKGPFCVLKCPQLNRPLLPEEVSAEILKTLLSAAENYLGGPVHNAVITVPAYFMPNQCTATEKAGHMAGLKKVKLLREPEAAALAYGLARKTPQVVLVFDLGGGTFDVSVLEVGDGLVEVIATSGDAHLGGDDFTNVIVNWIMEQFTAAHGVDTTSLVRGDPFTMGRIYDEAEKIKIKLSSQKEVRIDISYIWKDISINYTLTRSKFESMSKSLLQRLLRPVREVAVMAGVNLPSESGLMSIFDEELYLTDSDDNDDENDILEDIFGTNKNDNSSSNNDKSNNKNNSRNKGNNNVNDMIDYNDIDINELRKLQTTNKKLAREKNKLKGNTMKQVRALQKSTGDTSLTNFPGGQAINEVLLVGGATRMPAVQRLVKTLTSVTPTGSVNPDEAVSLGAAVMAGILDGEITDMQVMSAWQAAVYRTLYEQKDKLEKSGIINNVESTDITISSTTTTNNSRTKSRRDKESNSAKDDKIVQRTFLKRKSKQ